MRDNGTKPLNVYDARTDPIMQSPWVLPLESDWLDTMKMSRIGIKNHILMKKIWHTIWNLKDIEGYRENPQRLNNEILDLVNKALEIEWEKYK